ncbi:MAG: N-acetylglucosamine kinase [Hyphomicrobiales bacterium]|nr:N-acetylglucosamine kinase [Hyphomicrobiales bacterium]
MSVFLGVDGGGTGCRAIVGDLEGNHLGYGKSGPANIMTGYSSAVSNIVEACRKAVADAGLSVDELSTASVYLGLAGANIGDYARDMKEALPFRRCRIETDAMMALQGAIGDADGVVAVIGTGSVFVYRKKGITRTAGGWGFTVGDLGSGSRLGRSLLQETLLSFDGIIEGSGLTRYVLSEFENDPQTIVEYAHTAKPGEFGKFAPLIFEHAKIDDPIAMTILQDAVSDVEATLDAILANCNQQLCMLGGLGEKYSKLIGERFTSIICDPIGDSASGALSLAVRNFSQHREYDVV